MSPTAAPIRHLDHELAEDDEPRSVVVRGELDHPDHERDARGVVHARLALERHPRAPLDLALAEHREHHGRIGRRERRADDSRRHPFEPEHVVGEDRDEPGSRERPEDAEREDRREGAPEAPPADVHAAVEEDDDQRDHGDPLHREDRDLLVEAREEVRDDGGHDEKDRRRRNRNPRRQASSRERRAQRRPEGEEDGGEVGDLGHGQVSPTSLPGTPSLTLKQRLCRRRVERPRFMPRLGRTRWRPRPVARTARGSGGRPATPPAAPTGRRARTRRRPARPPRRRRRARVATTVRSGATSSSAWWWKLSTSISSTPSAACSRLPGSIEIGWRGCGGTSSDRRRATRARPPSRRFQPRSEGCSAHSGCTRRRPGRACRRARRSGSGCPRHMPRIGRPRSSARSTSSSSKASRCGSVGRELLVRLLAVAARARCRGRRRGGCRRRRRAPPRGVPSTRGSVRATPPASATGRWKPTPA